MQNTFVANCYVFKHSNYESRVNDEFYDVSVFSIRSPHESGLFTRACPYSESILAVLLIVTPCYECLFPNANNENLEINPFECHLSGLVR